MSRRFLAGMAPTSGSGTASRPPSPLAGQQHFRTDKGFLETYDGTAWRVFGLVVVGALADVTNPLTDQLVLLSTDNNIYQWSGSAWIPVQATGPTAKWWASGTGQTLTASANVKLQFNNAQQTNTGVVTANASPSDTFTAVLAGSYDVDAGVRSTVAGGVMEMAVYSPGNVAFAVGNVLLPSGSGGRSGSVSGRIVLAAGDTFAVNVFNSGTAGAVDTSWGKATHLSVRFVGP